MTIRALFLATVASASLLASGAEAGNTSGIIDATYGNGSNGVGSTWNADGALNYNTGWNNISLEGNVGYAHTNGSGGHSWDFGGSVIWSGSNTRVAGSVVHYSNSGFNETTYGAGVVFFPGQSWDFYAQGGGLSGSASGSYFGGGINWYICPNFGLNGDIHYGTLGGLHETDYSLKGEWLISDSTPVSVRGGWTRTEFNFPGGQTNIWFLGLTLYANGSGAQGLPDRKHSGALTDIAPIHPLGFTF